MDKKLREMVTEMLIRHEGLRLKPYRCTAGKLTIGVGRNLDDKGIDEDEARFLLRRDINECKADLLIIFGFDRLNKINDVRLAALIDLRFNLGGGGFRKFKRFIQAAKDADWQTAANELIDSKWAGQVGDRANEIIWMIREGIQ